MEEWIDYWVNRSKNRWVGEKMHRQHYMDWQMNRMKTDGLIGTKIEEIDPWTAGWMNGQI